MKYLIGGITGLIAGTILGILILGIVVVKEMNESFTAEIYRLEKKIELIQLPSPKTSER